MFTITELELAQKKCPDKMNRLLTELGGIQATDANITNAVLRLMPPSELRQLSDIEIYAVLLNAAGIEYRIGNPDAMLDAVVSNEKAVLRAITQPPLEYKVCDTQEVEIAGRAEDEKSIKGLAEFLLFEPLKVQRITPLNKTVENKWKYFMSKVKELPESAFRNEKPRMVTEKQLMEMLHEGRKFSFIGIKKGSPIFSNTSDAKKLLFVFGLINDIKKSI